MRNASRQPAQVAPDEGPRRTSFVCPCCGREIVTAIEGLFSDPTAGSKRRFCSPSCRQAAWRRRKAGAPEATPLQHRGGRSRALAEGGGPTGRASKP
jgi:hypothetical protein